MIGATGWHWEQKEQPKDFLGARGPTKAYVAYVARGLTCPFSISPADSLGAHESKRTSDLDLLR